MRDRNKPVAISPTDGGWWAIELSSGTCKQIVCFGIVEREDGTRFNVAYDGETGLSADFYIETWGEEWFYAYLGHEPTAEEIQQVLEQRRAEVSNEMKDAGVQ